VKNTLNSLKTIVQGFSRGETDLFPVMIKCVLNTKLIYRKETYQYIEVKKETLNSSLYILSAYILLLFINWLKKCFLHD